MPGLRIKKAGEEPEIKVSKRKQMFIAKIHKGPHGEVLVISDEEIIGKRFEEGKQQLDLTKPFYTGERKEEKELKELVKSAYILHLTGRKTVELFIKKGLVDKEKILVVKGVPHAEVCLAEN